MKGGVKPPIRKEEGQVIKEWRMKTPSKTTEVVTDTKRYSRGFPWTGVLSKGDQKTISSREMVYKTRQTIFVDIDRKVNIDRKKTNPLK